MGRWVGIEDGAIVVAVFSEAVLFGVRTQINHGVLLWPRIRAW